MFQFNSRPKFTYNKNHKRATNHCSNGNNSSIIYKINYITPTYCIQNHFVLLLHTLPQQSGTSIKLKKWFTKNISFIPGIHYRLWMVSGKFHSEYSLYFHSVDISISNLSDYGKFSEWTRSVSQIKFASQKVDGRSNKKC